MNTHKKALKNKNGKTNIVNKVYIYVKNQVSVITLCTFQMMKLISRMIGYNFKKILLNNWMNGIIMIMYIMLEENQDIIFKHI